MSKPINRPEYQYFEDLKVGQVFYYYSYSSDAGMAMKVDNLGYEHFNAVDLKTAKMLKLNYDAYTLPIKNMHAVEVLKPVHCKDCIYYAPNIRMCKLHASGSFLGHVKRESDYCSSGKPRNVSENK